MPAIGETIGSYQVLRQLGTGAMGEVYLAEHRHLKRKAAVKLLAPELVGRPDLLERFFLEARATSAIAHPGIVQVFDCELDASGRPYIVMEYLDGETLAAVLARRGALPGATVARLGRGMAEALEAAHAKGIVHRDLKPENIFVQTEPPDSVKLVDFGIAKLAGDFRAGQVHQTRSGALMGTPLYMSPEQCRDSANLDSRTDLYSLGCVLYEMLTGRPPFTQTSLGDLVVAHMTEAPRDARDVNPTVPPALAELTAELLKKNPDDRPPGMRAVAERLAAFVGGLTTVPESLARPGVAAAPAAMPAGTKSKTTFGDSAAELVDDAVPARSRSPLGYALGAAAILAVVAGGLALTRRPTPPAVSADTVATKSVATPTAAVAASPPGVVTAKAKSSMATEPSTGPSFANKKGTSEPSAVKKAGHHHAASLVEALNGAPSPPPPPAATADSATPPVSGPADYAGVWEGPWTDAEHHQNGRLYLQVGAGGTANGWLSNGAAKQSFRLVGRADSPGEIALACECPPGQGFSARVSLRIGEGAALRGRITLSAAAGVFGESRVVLHRAAAR